MGGSNDASNLVEVTVTQHAMFHFCNYQLWGNEEDRLAWLGLSKISTKEEYVSQLLSLARNKALDPKVKEKRKKKLQEIGHQQGEKNSQYGKMWITDGTERGSYRINKDEPIPEGFYKGRITPEKLKFIYIITTPSGETLTVEYLSVFCKERNLCNSCLRRVLAGQRSQYKGYTGYKILKDEHKINEPT
jgi:hypothetical protein